MNAKEISDALAKDAASIAAYLLREGKRVGREWKAGSINGEPGDSLSVCIAGAKAGVWCDFATGAAGDLLDLWMEVRGCTLVQAMDDAKKRLGIRDTMPERPQKTYALPEKPRGKLATATEGRALQWLTARGLTPKTIGAFKVVEQVRGESVFAVFPYFSEEGEYLNGKSRNIDNKKDMRQEAGAMPCLFGWHLIDPKERTVAIAEGEIDAMTLHQVGIPALSVNAGAGNHQWIENDWDRLARFSEILIFFDCDDAGEKGAREVISRLGPERCKRVRLENGAKDANEYLLSGAELVDFDAMVQMAKPLDPEELRSAAEYFEQVVDLFYPDPNAPQTPVLHIDRDLDWFRFRGGEVSVWTGINGHGKSLLLSQVQIGLMAQGQRFVVFSGELKPANLLERSVKQAAGLGRPTRAYIRAIGEWMRERYWLFDLQGSAKLDRLLEVFTYAFQRYGCTQFVIDSLMMTDVPEDGPGSMTSQKDAMRKLTGFAKRFDVHVHLVAHPRKARDESAAPNKMDVAGSGKITDGADNVFSVWSAQKDQSKVPEEADAGLPDGKLELQKQRNGDVQRFTQRLWFDEPAKQYRTQQRRVPLSFVPFSNQEATS